MRWARGGVWRVALADVLGNLVHGCTLVALWMGKKGGIPCTRLSVKTQSSRWVGVTLTQSESYNIMSHSGRRKYSDPTDPHPFPRKELDPQSTSEVSYNSHGELEKGGPS